MIDKLVYTAMTGAKHAMGQMTTTTNNLANVNTPGFREMIATFRAVPLEGDGAATRSFVVDSTPGASFKPGTIESTGNPLDFAIQGEGFFAVRRDDGSEAYTRAGRFYTDSTGALKLGQGLTVVGEGGDLSIPAGAQIEVGSDGTLSVRIGNQTAFNQIGKLKLVKPDELALKRAKDGLFEVPGAGAEVDPSVRMKQGAIETSNVSASNAMVEMIGQTRMFELNMKMMQSAQDNSRAANQLLSIAR